MEAEDGVVETVQRSKVPVPIKRNREIIRKPIKFDRLEKNYWSTQYYYLYCILIGNGVDGIPISFRFALDISGAFYILVLVVFSFIFTIPIIYMEIFLGKYTGLTNGQMYRMVPLFFGYCALMFMMNMFHTPTVANDTSAFFISAMQFAINERHMIRCPADALDCYNEPLRNVSGADCHPAFYGLNCSGHTYRYVSQYLFWSRSKNEMVAHSYALWQSVVANIITWCATVGLCIGGIRFIGMMMRLSFILNFVIYTTIFVMGMAAKGSMNGLVNLVQFRMESVQVSELFMIIFYNTMKLGLCHPMGYMTYSAFADRNRKTGPASEAVLLTSANICLTIYFLVVLHAVAGNLAYTFGLSISQVFVPFAGVYCAMISEFLQRLKTPVLFIVTFHIASWILETTKLAVMVYMYILNLYDFFPGVSKYQTYVFIAVGIVGLFLNIMGTILKLREFVAPILILCEMQFLRAVKLLGESLLVFYCYGVSRLNDDIHFMTGKRPIKYWRILWNIYPAMLLIGMGILTIAKLPENESPMGIYSDFPNIPARNVLFGSFILITLYLCVIFIAIFFYIIVGVRTISSIINLLKPQFFWGPQKRESRIARKCFAPRTTIRSQPPKKKKIRFRANSIKLLHERDAVKHVAQGRIFLDSIFYANIGLDVNVPRRRI